MKTFLKSGFVACLSVSVVLTAIAPTHFAHADDSAGTGEVHASCAPRSGKQDLIALGAVSLLGAVVGRGAWRGMTRGQELGGTAIEAYTAASGMTGTLAATAGFGGYVAVDSALRANCSVAGNDHASIANQTSRNRSRLGLGAELTNEAGETEGSAAAASDAR